MLEDNLQPHPSASPATAEEVEIKKPPSRGVGDVPTGNSRYLWVIEDVEEFGSVLDLNTLADAKSLEDTHVEILDDV